MKINRDGKNRTVLLTRRYAFKIPSLRSWQDFLYGLLNNRTEARVGRSGNPAACPVLWHIPGGWLVVMPRLRILTEEEFQRVDTEKLAASGNLVVEHKPDSFGWFNGLLCAVDYGWGN